MKVSSATEVLRRMLDEHGIECTYGYGIVSYKSDSHWCNAWEYGDGMMCVSMGYFTPEQAIAATLGRGTCHNVEEYPFIWSFTCSECGVHSITEGRGFNFCPNCGRRIVEVTE